MTHTAKSMNEAKHFVELDGCVEMIINFEIEMLVACSIKICGMNRVYLHMKFDDNESITPHQLIVRRTATLRHLIAKPH